MIDSLFTGNVLGHKSDIAGGWAGWVHGRTGAVPGRRARPCHLAPPSADASAPCFPASLRPADGTLRDYDFRTFNNIVGDYYIAPRFLEKVPSVCVCVGGGVCVCGAQV